MRRVVGLSAFAGLGLATFLASAPAHADCRTTSVCYWSGGRQICHSERQCFTPRVPVCTYVNRCTPVRSCTTYYGRTTCVYRDVCRSERVCS